MKTSSMIFAVLSTIGSASVLHAQSTSRTHGAWFTGDGFWGKNNCTHCEQSVDGFGGGVAVGGTIKPSTRLGVEATGWFGSIDVRTSFGSTSGSEGVFTLMPLVRFYPVANSGFSIHGGAGFGLTTNSSGGGRTGVAVKIGAAYEFRVAQPTSFMVFAQNSVVHAGGGRANLLQLGAGITVH